LLAGEVRQREEVVVEQWVWSMQAWLGLKPLGGVPKRHYRRWIGPGFTVFFCPAHLRYELMSYMPIFRQLISDKGALEAEF